MTTLSRSDWEQRVQAEYAKLLRKRRPDYSETLAMNMAAMAVTFGTRGRKQIDPVRMAEILWKKAAPP